MLKTQEIYTKIAQLCVLNGLNLRQLEKNANLKDKCLDNIRRGHEPTFNTMLSVLDYFNVSFEAFCGRIEGCSALNNHETELIALFRELNEEGKTAMLSMARGLATQGIYKKCDMVEGKA